MNGWILFISKIEIMVTMGIGAFSAITGKLRKLAATLLIFEIITNIGSVIWAVIHVRSVSDSWSETLKYFRENFSKPFGPLDYTEYEKAIEERDCKIEALEEENRELQEHYLLLHGLKKPSRKKTTKKEEALDKDFDV